MVHKTKSGNKIDLKLFDRKKLYSIRILQSALGKEAFKSIQFQDDFKPITIFDRAHYEQMNHNNYDI